MAGSDSWASRGFASPKAKSEVALALREAERLSMSMSCVVQYDGGDGGSPAVAARSGEDCLKEVEWAVEGERERGRLWVWMWWLGKDDVTRLQRRWPVLSPT